MRLPLDTPFVVDGPGSRGGCGGGYTVQSSDLAVTIARERLTSAVSLSPIPDPVRLVLDRNAINQSTTRVRAREWVRNLIGGADTGWIDAHAVRIGLGRERYPAVICGAGPGLSSVRGDRLRDHGLVFAVNAATRAVDHDVAVCVEGNELAHKLDPSRCSTGALVCDLSSHPRNLSGYRYPLLAACTELSRRVLRETGSGQIRNTWCSTSGVTAAISLAYSWGLDPIYLVGNDLGYPDGAVYAPETGLDDRIDLVSGEYLWSDRSASAPRPGNPLPKQIQLLRARDNSGQWVNTTRSLSGVGDWIASFVRSSGARIMSLDTHGLAITGVPVVTAEIPSAKRAPVSIPDPMRLGLLATLRRYREELARGVVNLGDAVWLELRVPIYGPWIAGALIDLLMLRGLLTPRNAFVRYCLARKHERDAIEICRRGAAELAAELDRS